jgi:NAD(P)H-hydrate epimerase
MENAGRAVAEVVISLLKRKNRARVFVVCGKGNNGGDGYVIARHLLNAGFDVRVVLCGDREKVQGDARVNLDVLERLGHEVEQLEPAGADVASRIRDMAADADMVVDALLGTGLQGRLREPYRSLIDAINAVACPILAVDIPSGLDCDTGEPLGAAVRAACTVTFVAVKKGFAASPNASTYVGEIYIASIGVEPAVQLDNPS